MTPSDQAALLALARDYWTRTTPTSFTGHGRLYRAFTGRKAQLKTRDEIGDFPLQSSFR